MNQESDEYSGEEDKDVVEVGIFRRDNTTSKEFEETEVHCKKKKISKKSTRRVTRNQTKLKYQEVHVKESLRNHLQKCHE